MTDPLTLIEDNRPHVRDVLPGERAAARAILEAAIQAEAEDPVATPLPVGRRRRRRIATLAGSFAAAAAAVTTGLLFWPTATPNAMAGWEAVPEQMAPEDVAAVDAHCREGMRVPELDDSLDFDGLDLVHVDQRGTTALALYSGTVDGEVLDGSCMITAGSDGWQAEPENFSGGVGGSFRTGGPEVEEWFPGPVIWANYSFSGDFGGDAMVSDITGAVPDSVARVDIVHDGERLATVLTDGQFSAFWPTDVEPQEVSVEMFDASGELISTYEVPVEDFPTVPDDWESEGEPIVDVGRGGVVVVESEIELFDESGQVIPDED